MSSQAEPAPARTEHRSEHNDMYELYIGLLTIISLAGMLVLYLLELFNPDSPAISILRSADTLFCIVFIFDFVRSLLAAPNKREYLFWHGILDLLGSIPAFPALRFARVARISRILRLLKGRNARSLAREFVERRAESALYVTGLLAFLLLVIGSSLAVGFEHDAEGSNITNGRDAFWWAYVTITTVGYGDRFPVTNAGRIIGMVLMTFGIGIFGVLTSFMSSLFLAPKRADEAAPVERDQQLQADIAALRREIAELNQRLQERLPGSESFADAH